MRYWKLIIYTTGEEYETKEFLINEPEFRQYQKAIAEGKDFLVLEDKVIKRNQIKEILPADEIVSEYRKQGLELPGLLEPAKFPLIEIKSKLEKISDYAERTHDTFYARMGWEHGGDCACKKNQSVK